MNPLLDTFTTPFQTPPFHLIKTEHYLPALHKAIAEAKQEIESIKTREEKATFKNTIEALEQTGENVSRIAEIFFNLNEAETSEEMQALAQEFSPILSDYSNDILLDADLFARVKAVWDNRASFDLDKEESKLLEKSYKSFVRNGALLDEMGKTRLRNIDKELGKASLTFGEHLLAETNSYQLVIEDEDTLTGIPESALETAAVTAEELGHPGKWVFTLQFPSYMALTTYADDRELRERIVKAYASRASQGDEMDNSELVNKIVALRHERAQLLGYDNHAHFVLEERMAGDASKVASFLDNLLDASLPVAKRELEELQEFANSMGGPAKLERWDIAYYAEKLKKERYEVDDEMLKPFFQLEKVIDGVFAVATKLYDIIFVEDTTIPKYHKDVITYRVEDGNGRHIAVFYADFFPRAGKRNGAWMTSFRGQSISNGKEQRPLVSIVCNFTKPGKTTPSLLTFNEVTTLFHEFGHALHGMLAEGKYESLTGTSVYWDFVELPSQIMENWVFEKECLDLFAKHYETDEKISEELIERIKKSANFMEGYQTLRQISFALLDMAYHGEIPGNIADIKAFEQEIMGKVSLVPAIPNTSFSTSFGHIFQGGYSSGYYSYKWAEVLDADAFEYFKEKGIFNKEVANAFKKFVLSAGGVEHPMELYKKFRGREADPKALLRRAGLVEAE